MENLDRKKLWDLDATSPLHSSATSTVEDYANQGSSHTRSNTDASNVGEYATSSTHSQQSTPTADCSGKSGSNVTTINHHYLSSTHEVTLIDLSMPPPPLPPPMPAGTKPNASNRGRTAYGGAELSGSSSSAASSGGPSSSISLNTEGGMFKHQAYGSGNDMTSNSAQNYFRTRDHAYTHQPHPPVHPHYPPLQPIQHYIASGEVSASASATNLAPGKINSRSRSIDSKPLLLRRPEINKPSTSSTSSAASAAGGVCFRASSLTRRVSLSNKSSLTSSTQQQRRPNVDLMSAFPSKRFSTGVHAGLSMHNPASTGAVAVYSNNSSAMLSPRSLISTTLPTSTQTKAAAQSAITDELKARNFAVNNHTAAHFSGTLKTTTNQFAYTKTGTGVSRGKENVVPASASTKNATSALTAAQAITTNAEAEAAKVNPPAPASLHASSDDALDRSDGNPLMKNNNDANNSERAAASVKQIIQNIEQQLMLGDNLVDADKQLEALEKALEAGSPTSDSGGNDYAPSIDAATAIKHDLLDDGNNDVNAHDDVNLHPFLCNYDNHHNSAVITPAVTEPAAALACNSVGRSTASPTATVITTVPAATTNHLQQGQRVLRMICAEKQRTNAERDKLKRAVAERDMYRDHYVSICESSKWRRMQYEELESRYELLKTENEELRKKLSKHRHKKRRAALEVDSQIATLQQQYAEELQKQKQKRHNEKKLRLKQEKELQLFSEQQQQLQQQQQQHVEPRISSSHEKCQQAAQLAVKTAVQNVKKKYDAEMEELEIQNVALMLENRDLKHANTALRHGMSDLEQKLTETQRTIAKNIAPPASPTQHIATATSKSLPNSPQKASAGVQTEKILFAGGGSAPSSPIARDVSTSTTKLDANGFTTPANNSNHRLRLSKLTFENSASVTVGSEQQQQPGSSKHSSATHLMSPRNDIRQPTMYTDNNYDDAGFSAIYSDDDGDGGKKSSSRAALRQSFASSTPAARHSQPLLPPQPPPLPPSFSSSNNMQTSKDNNSGVKPSSSSSHAQLLRSLSTQHDAHPVGALRQQLLQQPPPPQRATVTRQIFETSFTTSTPRTLVREVASDDYIRAAYMLASTTNHPNGPPNNNSSRRLKPLSTADANMLSSGATGDDGDDEQADGDEKDRNEGGVNMRQRDEIVTGTSSTGSEQQQQGLDAASNGNSTSATRKRQSRRHVYDLMDDNNKAHGDDGCSSPPFRAAKGNNGVKGLGGFMLPKGVASVAARRLERKVALSKGGWSNAAAAGAAGVDDLPENNNSNGRHLKMTTSMPFYNPSSRWIPNVRGSAVDIANLGTSV